MQYVTSAFIGCLDVTDPNLDFYVDNLLCLSFIILWLWMRASITFGDDDNDDEEDNDDDDDDDYVDYTMMIMIVLCIAMQVALEVFLSFV